MSSKPAVKVREPSPATLRRYGLTLQRWQKMLTHQGGACAVCHRIPPSGILNIDHEHVRGWKKMPPEKRRIFVRGLVCWMCNLIFLRRGATPERLRSGADYLEKYLRLRDKRMKRV